jgi:hypothetical protein
MYLLSRSLFLSWLFFDLLMLSVSWCFLFPQRYFSQLQNVGENQDRMMPLKEDDVMPTLFQVCESLTTDTCLNDFIEENEEKKCVCVRGGEGGGRNYNHVGFIISILVAEYFLSHFNLNFDAQVGKSVFFNASHSGELLCFANDNDALYANNKGPLGFRVFVALLSIAINEYVLLCSGTIVTNGFGETSRRPAFPFLARLGCRVNPLTPSHTCDTYPPPHSHRTFRRAQRDGQPRVLAAPQRGIP